ncbi:MAG: monomethylamine:corrinoid methyltransferase [Lachnospiraceae bacterium]|jgi:methylamine--corrinoid protein Co-methyltransferase
MDAGKFLELCERSKQGEQISSDDWNIKYVAKNMKKLVKEYDLTWDKQVVIPEDEQLFKNLFAAAKRFLCETGIYNISTGRVLKFTEEEVEEGIRNMKTELVMGEGKDAVTLVARKAEDDRDPVIWAGNPGCPTPEELFYPILQSIVKEPLIDLLTCGSLVTVDGYPVHNGEPSELLAVRRELQYLRRALEEAGRPGMGMLAAESAVTEIGDLAATYEKALRPCDAHLISMFNELMMDNGNLVRAANTLDYKMKNASLACTIVGGMGGDAPGTTVLMIASMLAANIICMADYHLCHPIHMHEIVTTARGCLWLQAALCQTFAQEAPAIIVCDIWPASGAMTKELFYEVAANAIVATVSGGHLEGVGATAGSYPNGTGLEVRFMAEVGKAVTRQKLTRKQANEIVLKLLEKYEPILQKKNSNLGVCFSEAYDMQTITPVPKWQAMYEEVKAELKEMGLEL